MIWQAASIISNPTINQIIWWSNPSDALHALIESRNEYPEFEKQNQPIYEKFSSRDKFIKFYWRLYGAHKTWSEHFCHTQTHSQQHAYARLIDISFYFYFSWKLVPKQHSADDNNSLYTFLFILFILPSCHTIYMMTHSRTQTHFTFDSTSSCIVVRRY